VHRADRVGVVVEQANQPEVGLPVRRELLAPFAAEAIGQGILTLVDGVEVATDPDARLAMQPRVAAGLAALHQEDSAAVAHHDVGNQLLVGGIVLGDRALDEPTATRDRHSQQLEIGSIGRSQTDEFAATGDLVARQARGRVLSLLEANRSGMDGPASLGVGAQTHRPVLALQGAAKGWRDTVFRHRTTPYRQKCAESVSASTESGSKR